MESCTHEIVIWYKKYTGIRYTYRQKCSFDSMEEAKAALQKKMDELDDDGFVHIEGTVNRITPKEEQETSQEPTHYKIVAKDMFGGWVCSLLPINEDLQAALDKMDEDLKLVDIYKVTMPFKSAYPHPQANRRLVVRHI